VRFAAKQSRIASALGLRAGDVFSDLQHTVQL
jgi:hypothetical protein